MPAFMRLCMESVWVLGRFSRWIQIQWHVSQSSSVRLSGNFHEIRFRGLMYNRPSKGGGRVLIEIDWAGEKEVGKETDREKVTRDRKWLPRVDSAITRHSHAQIFHKMWQKKKGKVHLIHAWREEKTYPFVSTLSSLQHFAVIYGSIHFLYQRIQPPDFLAKILV